MLSPEYMDHIPQPFVSIKDVGDEPLHPDSPEDQAEWERRLDRSAEAYYRFLMQHVSRLRRAKKKEMEKESDSEDQSPDINLTYDGLLQRKMRKKR